MTPKRKPPLRLVLPQFRVAVNVRKSTKDDAYVILELAEFEALVAAAGKKA